MRRTIRAANLAFLACSLTFAVEPVRAVHGTITKIDSGAKTISVKTADGANHTLRFVARTTGHGTEAAARDTFHGLKEGTEVVAHYSVKGTDETAVEVDRIGKDGMKAAEGTVRGVNRAGKEIVVRSAEGTEQVFRLADHAAADAGTDAWVKLRRNPRKSLCTTPKTPGRRLPISSRRTELAALRDGMTGGSRKCCLLFFPKSCPLLSHVICVLPPIIPCRY